MVVGVPLIDIWPFSIVTSPLYDHCMTTSIDSRSQPLTQHPKEEAGNTSAEPRTNRSRSRSPIPPSASPLTPAVRPVLPVTSHVIGDSSDKSEPRAQDANGITKLDLIDRPPARPFSGDDATDAIALRAAISSLQFQRQKAEQDIKALRGIRDDALARPDEFQQHILDVASQQAKPPKDFDFSFKDRTRTGSEDSDAEEGDGSSDQPAFPAFPLPQDVVRCPPINWDKYHIVGEPLARMHDAQTGIIDPNGKHTNAVAAPYDPAVDKIEKRQGAAGGKKADSKRASTSRRQSRV